MLKSRDLTKVLIQLSIGLKVWSWQSSDNDQWPKQGPFVYINLWTMQWFQLHREQNQHLKKPTWNDVENVLPISWVFSTISWVFSTISWVSSPISWVSSFISALRQSSNPISWVFSLFLGFSPHYSYRILMITWITSWYFHLPTSQVWSLLPAPTPPTPVTSVPGDHASDDGTDGGSEVQTRGVSDDWLWLVNQPPPNVPPPEIRPY